MCINGDSYFEKRKFSKMKISVLARILALLMGAARPPSSRNGRAAGAIVLRMVLMQNPQTTDFPENFHE
ncbi:MAG: hypothetical protein CVV32_05950 [Methanomicrobiales archaeon HGW-Methanomicrobiales-3]|jgi:hypothetical protein|nr:MAG: hypothetical protein CVV32_05950 [Methanomicrobiales archaeon HGW-Methanomicrobiales-3]